MKRITLLFVLAAAIAAAQSKPEPPIEQSPVMMVAYGRHALEYSVGQWDFALGEDSGKDMIDGSYNFCVGPESCAKVIHESCIIDVPERIDKFPAPIYSDPSAHTDGAALAYESIGAGLRIADEQNKHCGYDKRRIDTLLRLALFVDPRLMAEIAELRMEVAALKKQIKRDYQTQQAAECQVPMGRDELTREGWVIRKPNGQIWSVFSAQPSEADRLNLLPECKDDQPKKGAPTKFKEQP